MPYYTQQFINILQLGSIYALIALGYSLVYGILSMINFAHGDLFMVGAFFCLLLVTLLAIPFWLAFLLAVAATALLGVLIERFAYRPIRNAPRVSAIITALGCGLVIENITLALSPYPRRMPTLFTNTLYHFDGVTISSLQIFIIGISIFLMALLDFIINKTSFGIAMRALSVDRMMVALLGIPANRIISMTFAIGAALGGSAGILYALAYPVIGASMGMLVGWKAFVAAVIGGIGNIRGAVLGGYILGATEIISVTVLPSTYRDLISYSLLLVILIFKPYGLLGKAPLQKV
ncbi:MAG: ABC transporter permease [Verrucomicrobia bacterium RIFCSPHIGHO2_12_FULL_41_10]|nr:MAG: ABC transporter permease [Verrucomicrobia bacterium RIFCSPHIGHO2_12_FULL_41_10]HLB32653.1 branched-chain amino acid ABC transporter permease [Chthoniobacterales bacterium]